MNVGDVVIIIDPTHPRVGEIAKVIVSWGPSGIRLSGSPNFKSSWFEMRQLKLLEGVELKLAARLTPQKTKAQFLAEDPFS